jgi:hypothetical protein
MRTTWGPLSVTNTASYLDPTDTMFGSYLVAHTSICIAMFRYEGATLPVLV